MKMKKTAVFLSIILLLSTLNTILYADDTEKLNLNAAKVEDLEKIPGLNLELAKKIIAAREENGEFVDMEELLDIPGINTQLLRQLKKYLLIESLDGCNC